MRQLACEADIIPAVLGEKGQILDLGRAKRLVTPGQRRALAHRDGGCTFPGATYPRPGATPTTSSTGPKVADQTVQLRAALPPPPHLGPPARHHRRRRRDRCPVETAMTPPHTRPPKGRATGLRPVDDAGRRRAAA
nr:hypothetical protein [Serinicoccus marinus]